MVPGFRHVEKTDLQFEFNSVTLRCLTWYNKIHRPPVADSGRYMPCTMADQTHKGPVPVIACKSNAIEFLNNLLMRLAQSDLEPRNVSNQTLLTPHPYCPRVASFANRDLRQFKENGPKNATLRTRPKLLWESEGQGDCPNSYDDNLSLFALAYEKHGRIDHAFAIAGVAELPKENWFDPQLSIESVAAAPSTTVVDVNLTGVLYFTRIAAVYLRQGNDDGSQDKSICILGSVASFKEQTGLFIYSPAKHGVLGLVRSTRKYLSHTHRIRINVVCPSMTKTRMSVETLRVWAEQGVPGNEPQEVADYVLTLASVPRSPYVGEMTGLAVFVEGGKGWEIEKDLDKCDASWIGEEMSRNAVKIEQALEYGLAWVDPK
ncbi:hypothetical protein SUNI508_04569 [Seiridium unicorne]|uniref:Uncharacterized protein n=1 Tax=Seiridium unicorne TaxID=138068 RepID=A0ABR2V7N2_9PEZI